MVAGRNVMALGGRGFSTEQSAALDPYVLHAGAPRPRICVEAEHVGD